MANHRDVVSGSNHETNCVLKPVAGENRAHIEVVGDDETIEPKLGSQQVCDNLPRQAGRSFLRLKTRIPTMTNHHAVHVVHKFAKHG